MINLDTYIIKTMDELSSLSEEWNNVVRNMENTEIFYKWEWTIAYLSHMYENTIELFIILLRDKGKCIGIVPLCIENRRIGLTAYKILHPIVNKTADYCNFYFMSNYNIYNLLKQVFDKMWEYKNMWDKVELYNFNTSDNVTYNLANILENYRGLSYISEKSVITPILNYDQPDTKYNKKQIKDIDRRQNKLEKEHKLEICINQPWNKALWDTFIYFHKEKWNNSIFNKSNYMSFYNSLIPLLEDKNQLEISYLKLDGEIAAIHFGFIYNKKVYYYIPAYSKDYSSKGVGLILLNQMIEYYRDKKEKFDFLRGDEGYKFYWTDKVYQNYNFYIFKSNNMKSLFLRIYIKIKLFAKKNKVIRHLYDWIKRN